MPSPSSSNRSSAGKVAVAQGLILECLCGVLNGGERLTEAGVSERFSVSRTPVREALLELTGLGLVELRRNCGAVVQPFGPDQIRDLYAVRTLLEVEATRLAASRMEPEVIDDLQEAFNRLKKNKLPDHQWHLDQQLHSAIAEASGNPRLASEIARQATLIQTVREAVSDAMQGIHTTTLNDHLRILDRLKARDADGAAEAMQKHLQQAADSAAKSVVQLRKQHRSNARQPSTRL